MTNEPSYWSSLQFVDKDNAVPQLYGDEYESEELLKLRKLLSQPNIQPPGIDLALLGEGYTAGGALFTELKQRIEANSRLNPYRSQKQEATRMAWAKADLASASPNPAFQASAKFRLLEGEPGGPPVPEVNQINTISVKKIVVVRNQRLWDKYEAARAALRSRTKSIEKKIDKVAPTLAPGPSLQGTEFQGFPIIDSEIGESLLFHGTDAKSYIVDSNIDPSRGRNKAQGATPNYGLLGQGAYFSDQIAKSATYTLCRLCKTFICACKGKAGKPVLRVTLLARVLLGRVHNAPTLSVAWDRGKLRQQAYTDDIKNSSDSILAAGSGFKKAAGTNEIAIRNIDQIYPEFIIYWQHNATSTSGPWDEASKIAMAEREKHRAAEADKRNDALFDIASERMWSFFNEFAS
jgi:hypothetical protein